MKYTRGGRSKNLEDRRGAPGRRAGARMPGGLPAIGGVGGIVVLLLVQLLGGGGDGLGSVLEGLAAGSQVDAQAPAGGTGIPANQDPDADQVDLVSFVLDDSQAFWADLFVASGREDWRDAKLVLFTEAIQSGCGFAPAAMGPFYCSLDDRVYIDLSFFDDLHRRFGAPGDFAQAYVIAHEIAHHVQNVLGIAADVRQQKQADPQQANDLSVRQELQADCFSGVWAFSAYDQLEPGDIDEGLTAAEAIGDDRLQAQAGAEVDSETWTHGSSAQRQRWFLRGFESGDPNQCDTFSATEL